MMRSILCTIVCVAFVIGCITNKKKNVKPPNIVWITSEDNSMHYQKIFDSNGIATPHIEKLAEQGVMFTHAFSNAPVCSAARSTLISGIYGPRMASHYHRKMQKVTMPEGTEMFPAYLRKAGYYTANNKKKDYNIVESEGTWDESSHKAHWRNREPGQPFFFVKNIMETHESRMHFTKEFFDSLKVAYDLNKYAVQPNHPKTDLFKFTNNFYRKKIVEMDSIAGTIISELEEDGLLDNTIIFYFGDHGGVLPGSKGYIYETGVHVPLVVYIPEQYKHLINQKRGSSSDRFVSFVDFGATVLNLANVTIPKGIDGKPFLGKNIGPEKDVAFSYTDRNDERYDMVRAVRKGKYKYMRNFMPFNCDALMNNYRYKQLAYQEWQSMFRNGDLNNLESAFFKPRSAEMLFDVENDPYETNNLANNPDHQTTKIELRQLLYSKLKQMPDLSFYPEFFLVKNALDNPVEFGEAHKTEINNYIEVSKLALKEFSQAKPGILKSLSANDPWERYWALIACNSFANNDKEIIDKATEISTNDNQLINRVRAAEMLGIIQAANPVEIITNALYNSTDGAESLLIMNSIVLLRDFYNYKFTIEYDNLNREVANNSFVKRRLEYLNVKK